MEPYTLCRSCGEKTSPNFPTCRKCGAKLHRYPTIYHPTSDMKSSRTCNVCGAKVRKNFLYCSKCGAKISFKKKKPESSLKITSKSRDIKICPKCYETIKQASKFCSKCGQSLQPELSLAPRTHVKLPIHFTKERASLESAIQKFDEIFSVSTLQQENNHEMWNKKKRMFLSQKQRFFDRKLSNDLFFIQLESLNEYLQTIGFIQEEELPVESEIIAKSNKEVEPEKRISEEKSPVMGKQSQFIEPVAISESESAKEEITTTDPVEPVSEEIRQLFRSIQYQVKDIIFQQGDVGAIARIIPYTGSIKEIIAEVEKDKIIMKCYLKGQDFQQVYLELKIEGMPRQPSWDDFWKDIILHGEEKLIKQIKLRHEIANRLTSLGTALVKVESTKESEISIQLTCNVSEHAIKHSYALFKDLQLFFDISFY